VLSVQRERKSRGQGLPERIFPATRETFVRALQLSPGMSLLNRPDQLAEGVSADPFLQGGGQGFSTNLDFVLPVNSGPWFRFSTPRHVPGLQLEQVRQRRGAIFVRSSSASRRFSAIRACMCRTVSSPARRTPFLPSVHTNGRFSVDCQSWLRATERGSERATWGSNCGAFATFCAYGPPPICLLARSSMGARR